MLAIAMMFSSCQDDDLGLETMMVPSNIVVNTDISIDGSGLVNFTVSADNAITYRFNFGDGTTATTLDGTYEKRFSRTGLNTYLVNVIAYGKGGISSSETIEIEVQSDFSDPETKQFLTGGSSKKWYVAAYLPGHLGVGQNTNDDGPIVDGGGFFSAAPNFGPECFYDDQITFSLNAEDNIVYTYNDFGESFVNWTYTTQFGGNGEEFVDECLEVGSATAVSVSLVPASSDIPNNASTGTLIELSPNAFIAYYIGQNQYEVLSIDDNNMVLRAVQANNTFLVWYIKLTTLSYELQGAGADGSDSNGSNSEE